MSEGNIASESPRRSSETASRNVFEIGSRTVDVIRVTPDSIKHNSRTGKPVNPVFFEYGYGKVGVKTLEWYLKVLAKQGRDAIGIKYQPTIEAGAVQVGEEGKAARLDQQRAEDLIAVMERMGIACADFVAESGGAPRALLAAQMHPEMVENFLLVHPAGVDRSGSTIAHGRVAHHQLRSVMDPRLLVERGKRILRRRHLEVEEPSHPSEEGPLSWAKRTRVEQKAVAHADLDSLIPEIQRANPNLRVSMIADPNDYNFPYRRLRKINQKNLFEFIKSKWHGHGIGHLQERVGEIDAALTRLETAERQNGPTTVSTG